MTFGLLRWFLGLACSASLLVSAAQADDPVADVLQTIAPPEDWLNEQEQALQYPLPAYRASSLRQSSSMGSAPAGELWQQPGVLEANVFTAELAGDDSPLGIRAWVDWIMLARGSVGDQPELLGTDDTVMGADTFGFDYKPGIETGLELALGNTTAFEVRYFWVDTWHDSSVAADPVGLSLPTAPVSPLGSPVLLDYHSDLQSLEFHFRATTGDVTWLAGFRYLEVDERLRFIGAPQGLFPGGVGRFAVDNDLSGFQIGADVLLWDDTNWFTLRGVAKTGIYYVDADATVGTTLGPLPGVPAAGRSSAQEVAFVGEFGLDVTLLLTANLRLRTGYRVIYMDGIAAASSLPSHTDFLAGATPVHVHADNSVLYHGLNLGLELAW